MTINHQEFLKRIKKTLYYGPSNPNRMTSHPLASRITTQFTETYRNFSIKTLDLNDISRLRQQTPCSMILTIIYLERLKQLDPAFLKTVSPSELFLVTLVSSTNRISTISLVTHMVASVFQMVSTKFYSDYDESDVFASTWAQEGQVDIERLKQLEIMFLNAIQWKILVSQNEFYGTLKTVEKLLAMKEGLARGSSFTYHELELLMPSLETVKLILNYTTILMFSYACGIAAIAFSSALLASIPAASILVSKSNTTALVPEKLMPKIDERFLEESIDLNLNPTCNFSINFPLLDRVTNWEIRKNQQDVTNFYFMNRKYDPVPLVW